MQKIEYLKNENRFLDEINFLPSFIIFEMPSFGKIKK